MGIEIHSPTASGSPGQTLTTNFVNQVTAYTVGMWGFVLSYGDRDFNVLRYSLGMASNLDSNGLELHTAINMNLQDSHDNVISIPDSQIYPICLAVTGSPQSQTGMSNVVGMPSGGPATPVTLPPQSDPYTVVQSFVTGVNLAFSPKDHNLYSTSASSSLSYNGTQGSMSGTATMIGSGGTPASEATVDAGFIVTTAQEPIFAVEPVTAQNASVQVTMSTLTSISEVVCMVQSWRVQFQGESRKLRTLRVGCTGQPTVSAGPDGIKNVVTVPNLGAFLSDAHGHVQDNAYSSCTALVIALP